MRFWRSFTILVRKKQKIQLILGIIVLIIFLGLAIWFAIKLFAEEENITNSGILYYQEDGQPKSIQSNTVSTQIIPETSPKAPKIISVKDFPVHFPIEVGAPVNFEVKWTDDNAGDKIKI